MRTAHGSLTAAAVAAARVLASRAHGATVDPGDRIAQALLPAPLSGALSVLTATRLGRGVLSPMLVHASMGMVDHIALRTAVLDALLRAALAAGTDQLVIVGAGLDSRAHRLPELAAASVFELDHPSSQRDKRARAESLPVHAGHLTHVAIDLTREALAPALFAAGFAPERPSVVLIEGVLPYLSRAATNALLRGLAPLCASGSQLVMSYIPANAIWLHGSRWLVQVCLRVAGEPLGELPEPPDLCAMICGSGFACGTDEELATWARTLDLPMRRAPLIAFERLVLAKKP